MRWPLGILLALLLLVGCAPHTPPIAELGPTSQDALALQSSTPGANWCVSRKWQDQAKRNFLLHYWEPWDAPDLKAGPTLAYDLADKVLASPGLGAHGRPQNHGWAQGLWDRANVAAWPNMPGPAITTAPGNLRVLPTSRPDFGSPPGWPGGYPFDRLQNSAIPAQVPVYIHHLSKDRGWLWLQTPQAWGWLPTRDVARLSPAQMQRLKQKPRLAVVTDETPLMSGGIQLHQVSIGTMLPLLGRDAKSYTVLAAARDTRGQAQLMPATLPTDSAKPWPLPLCADQLARLAAQIMGQPYGWGGMFGWRDCSATTCDLTAPFAIWLPRNSSDQAKKAGQQISLAGLSPTEKNQLIRSQAIPWLTLIWMPGHVMLYIGAPHGKPLVFHNAWGLKTYGPFCGEGRALISRAVITTLDYGPDQPDANSPPLINRIISMVLLAPPGAVKEE